MDNISMNFHPKGKPEVSARSYNKPVLTGGWLLLDWDGVSIAIHITDAEQIIDLGKQIERAGREFAGELEAQRVSADPFLPTPTPTECREIMEEVNLRG